MLAGPSNSSHANLGPGRERMPVGRRSSGMPARGRHNMGRATPSHVAALSRRRGGVKAMSGNGKRWLPAAAPPTPRFLLHPPACTTSPLASAPSCPCCTRWRGTCWSCGTCTCTSGGCRTCRCPARTRITCWQRCLPSGRKEILLRSPYCPQKLLWWQLQRCGRLLLSVYMLAEVFSHKVGGCEVPLPPSHPAPTHPLQKQLGRVGE